MSVRSLIEIVTEAALESRQDASDPETRKRLNRAANDIYLDLCAEFDIHALYTRVPVSITAAAQINTDWPYEVDTAPMDVQKFRFAELTDAVNSPTVQ